MFHYSLIKNSFPTPLGVVNCELNSDYDQIRIVDTITYVNGVSIIYKTISHTIEVVTFKQKSALYNGETITDCQGWIWRITKDNDKYESLEINCLLINYSSDVSLDADCGDHLDALCAGNNNWTLHIGTEDADIMHSRASVEDWLPLRFAGQLDDYSDNYNPFTNIQETGLTTKVPNLLKGEKIHFQYLVAYEKYNLNSVNTWLAVDENKRKLEKWIGIS